MENGAEGIEENTRYYLPAQKYTAAKILLNFHVIFTVAESMVWRCRQNSGSASCLSSCGLVNHLNVSFPAQGLAKAEGLSKPGHVLAL